MTQGETDAIKDVLNKDIRKLTSQEVFILNCLAIGILGIYDPMSFRKLTESMRKSNPSSDLYGQNKCNPIRQMRCKIRELPWLGLRDEERTEESQ